MKDEGKKRQDMVRRTKQFALLIVRLYSNLPKSTVAQVLGRQLLRSGTSVGAHYREAIRARSVAEFVSKLEGGLQELDETAYWLELLAESNTLPSKRLRPLMDETNQLLANVRRVRKNIKVETALLVTVS